MKKYKKQKFNKILNRKLGFTLVLLFLLMTVSIILVFAKYYAKESRKGVSTASGLYFTSNCLKQVDSIEDKNTFPDYLNTEKWLGVGSCTIPVQINNYENILLYNDVNLNITYNLYFCLLDEPVQGSSYHIRYTDRNHVEQTAELVKDQIFSLEGEYLPGGSANSNRVNLVITPEPGIDREQYISGRVAVWAVPTYPAYVAETGKLAAIIRATPNKGEFDFTAGFEIEDNLLNVDWETEGKPLLDSYSGLVYNIKTTGESQGVSHFFDITWNTKYLDIDIYNSYYLEAMKANQITEDADAKTKTMRIEAVSYTSMNINFYKTAEFNSNEFSTPDQFFKTVTVKDIIVDSSRP